jgi:UDP-2,3-diacylglucosamine pyrophosphatase LpxH
MLKKRKVEVVVLSDIHLGTFGCHAKELVQYLSTIKPKILVLNGDIIDMWQFSKRYWPKSHMQVIHKFIKWMSKGVKIYYITGNHDDFLRNYDDLSFGNITVCLEYQYKNIFITHGDLYDGVVKLKWLGILGSIGYDLAISIDRTLKKLGYKRSLSKFLNSFSI